MQEDTHVKLNEKTMKLNLENFLGMTHGFDKENRRLRIAIQVSHKNCGYHFCEVYKKRTEDFFLMTAFKGTRVKEKDQPANKEYIMQWKNKKLCNTYNNKRYNTYNVKNWELKNHKYILDVDSVYDLSEDENIRENIFKELCSNGIFDIWNPKAPCNRLEGVNNAQIELFRVFEIYNGINREDINVINSRFELHDKLKKDTYVDIKNPVLSDDEFKSTKNKLEHTLNRHQGFIRNRTYDKCI